MRLVFAGTPEFAARALQAIVEAGHAVPLVLTQPDRPAGRGMSPQASAVKTLALRHGLRVHQPASLKHAEARQPIEDAGADLMIVAAYGLILPAEVLELPRLGCLNIHASLLPRWRGAAPIQRAILAGDRETGITLMRMDAGLDTGPVLARESIPLAADETAATLHERLADLGAALVVRALARLAVDENSLPAQPQSEAGACYAAKLDKSEAWLDWRHSAQALDRRIRAFNPFPGAMTRFGEQTLKIWAAHPVEQGGAPGRILAVEDQGIVVSCGEQALCLTQLQKPGSKKLAARDFLRGFALRVGDSFETGAS